MDRKTLILMLTEAVLIVVLVVVVALDYNAKPPAETHVAAEKTVEKKETKKEVAKAKAHETEKKEAVKHEKKKKEEAVEKESKEHKAVAKKEKHAKAAKHAKKEKATAHKKAAPAKAASGDLPDVIAMKNAAYKKHKKGIVQFTHKKHIDKFKIACGECHHDENGEPLKELKAGDEVQGCIECHSKPGKAKKAKKGEKLSLEQKLEFHAEALHKNCISCHKKYNKKNKTKAAPVSCGKCHPKK